METISISPGESSTATGPIVDSSARAVLVLGMHRSGTSLLARVLNLLGVELGENLLPSTAANETGFWEHREVVALHTEVYAVFGHDWNSVSKLPALWWEDDRVRPLREKLAAMLKHDFSGNRLWGVKDPRLCDMLPMWRAVLAELNVTALCVLTFRNPVEVAKSLAKYHGTLPSRAYFLWLRSLLNAERDSRGLPRAIVSYESMLGDWRSQVNHIGDELRTEWSQTPDAAASAIGEFIRPQMRHYSVDDESFLHDDAAPDLVRRAYRAALDALRSRDVDRLSDTFDQINRELDEASPMVTQFIADADAQLLAGVNTQQQLNDARAENERLQQLMTQTTTEADEVRKAIVEKFTAAIRERDEQIDRLHQDIGRRLDQRRVQMLKSKQEKEVTPVAVKHSVVVIIPYYNGSGFIERAVKSVFDQTIPADEVVVVNDGSREDQKLALHELGKKYPFTIIDKENGGQGSARNAGVAGSKSDFICFLDQDDFYLPNHIEILTAGIPKDDYRFGWVYADLFEANGDGSVVRTSMVKEHAAHPKRTVVDLLGSDMFVLPSASLISRAAYEAVEGFDPQFVGYEDDDLFMRLFRKGFSNYFIDKPVTVWCIHTNSASYSIRMARSRMLYFKKLLKWFPDEPEKARFYFRDCLMRRFGPMFFVDALNAAKKQDPNRAEIFDNLKEYSKAVRADPSVSWEYKRRIKLAVYMLTNSSPRMVKTIETASRLPVLRNFRWCL